MCMADVYDSKAWKELLGEVERRGGRVIVTRMGFLLCMDGFPAFNQKRKGAISLMPAELINLSLPPHIRYDPDNMMVWMLIPSDMSSKSQLKYFDYVTRQELNPIAKDGVAGPDGPVSIKLFAASLDLKGKEKFYNQTAVQSYCGCSHCQVHFDKGPGGPIFDVARQYLPNDHPLRQANCIFNGHKFEYFKTEDRTASAIKTSQTLIKYIALRRRHGVEHFLGQKGPIMLRLYRTMEYSKFNVLEWMHNLKCAFDCFMNLLVGGDVNFDKRSRSSLKTLGLWKDLWPEGVATYLSAVCNNNNYC